MSAHILHITTRAGWEAAGDVYEAPSLTGEGFIHCSTRAQVVDVANRLFREVTELVVLCIDIGRVSAEIRYENCEGGDELYPHVYGGIPREAVVEVIDFAPDERGEFELPS